MTLKIDSTKKITEILSSTSSYLIKHLNYSYFGGVVGADEKVFKKAKIMPKLLLLNNALTEKGESILELAFMKSKNDPKMRKELHSAFRNIVKWIFLNSGEHSGPIKRYIKVIEQQCKFVIQVASDTKDHQLMTIVLEVYKLLMDGIQKLIKRKRIPLALAFTRVKSIHSTLVTISEYLLVSEEIISNFIFTQKGLDYFLNQLLSSSQSPSSTVENEDEEEEVIDTTTNSANPTVTKVEAPELEDDFLNDELFSYVSSKLSPSPTQAPSEEKILEQLDRPINAGDFVLTEFARTMTLIDSQFHGKGKDFTNNLDWSVNKKGYRQRIVFKKFDNSSKDEIWMLFKLNRVVEIKEIQIGFTNFWTVDSEVYIEPSSVIVETGLVEGETNSVCSLKKIDDKGFGNFGTTVYGLNLYAFNNQEQSSNVNELVENRLNSLQSLKARYIKFRMRNNSITCLENSPLITKISKPKALGINFCSIMGYDLNTVGNIDKTIENLRRTTSSKILFTVFKQEFTKISQKIAQDPEYIEYFKSNLEKILKLIDDKNISSVFSTKKSIIAQILKIFTKYNKELGSWVIEKLLDINCNTTQVSLLYDLIK